LCRITKVKRSQIENRARELCKLTRI